MHYYHYAAVQCTCSSVREYSDCKKVSPQIQSPFRAISFGASATFSSRFSPKMAM